MISLSDFLSEIGRAGLIAAKASSEANLARFLDYWEKGPDDVLQPVEVEVLVAGKTLKIPKLVLTPTKRMGLEELAVEFESEIVLDSGDDLKGNGPEPSDIQLTLSHGFFGTHKTKIHVKAIFKVEDEPEAMAKIQDRVNIALGKALNG